MPGSPSKPRPEAAATEPVEAPRPGTSRKPRKTGTQQPRAGKTPPRAVPDPAVPPLDAVDKPARGRADAGRKPRTRNVHRRGATAPPGPTELVEQKERTRVALELAAAGVNDWDEIARLAGFADRSGAWRAVQSALNRQEFAAVADLRRLVGLRYERIIRANWEAAVRLDESPAKDKATPRVLRALEGIRRTFGTDVEAERLADALRIPESEAERAAELIGIRDRIRLIKGDVDDGSATG